jgi:hypothetical protein
MALARVPFKYACASAADRAHPTQAPAPPASLLFPSLPQQQPPRRSGAPPSRCLQCRASQASLVHLLEEALGRASVGVAAAAAAALLPEARAYPRTVACACARLLAGGGGGGDAEQRRDALVRALRLSLDSEQQLLRASKVRGHAPVLRRRREALLCGAPPAQAAAIGLGGGGSSSSSSSSSSAGGGGGGGGGASAAALALEGKALRACVAARAVLSALLYFPGAAPRLQAAMDLAGELLNSQLSKGAFASDPHIYALRGLACYLVYRGVAEQQEAGAAAQAAAAPVAGTKRKRQAKALAAAAAAAAAASAAAAAAAAAEASAPAQQQQQQLLPLSAPMPSARAPHRAAEAPAPAAARPGAASTSTILSSARARALADAEAHLGSALRLAQGAIRSVRRALAAQLRQGASAALLPLPQLHARVTAAVLPWVDSLAGIPRLLQRVLEASGRGSAGRQAMISFLHCATCSGEGGEGEGEEEEEEEVLAVEEGAAARAGSAAGGEEASEEDG